MTNPINSLIIDHVEVKPKTTVMLSGLETDYKLSFKLHNDALCQKENFKTNALQRTENYLNTEASEAIYRSCIYSNFLYCPLT